MSTVTPEEFIQAWQSSATLDEVKEKTGMPRANCHTRATYYRTKGIPLKAIVRTRKIDWVALADLAAHAQEQSE